MFSACSPSACTTTEEIADGRRIKDGELLRYKSGFFGSKWLKCYMVLLSDGRLLIFNTNTDSKATEYFHVKEAARMMCVGMMTDRLPAQRPPLPANSSIHHLVGISLNEKGDRAYWLLFPSDAELEDWLEQISKLLPPVNQQPLGPMPPQMPNIAPTYSTHNPAPLPGSYQNQGPGYSAGLPQHPSTIFVERPEARSSGGLGVASGMAVGALAGFGIGSFFAPTVEALAVSEANETAGAATAAVAPVPESTPAVEPGATTESNFVFPNENAPDNDEEHAGGFGGFEDDGPEDEFGGFGDDG